MNPVYQKNLKILKKNHPETAQKIEAAAFTERINVFPSKAGPLTFRMTSEKKKDGFSQHH